METNKSAVIVREKQNLVNDISVCDVLIWCRVACWGHVGSNHWTGYSNNYQPIWGEKRKDRFQTGRHYRAVKECRKTIVKTKAFIVQQYPANNAKDDIIRIILKQRNENRESLFLTLTEEIWFLFWSCLTKLVLTITGSPFQRAVNTGNVTVYKLVGECCKDQDRPIHNRNE